MWKNRYSHVTHGDDIGRCGSRRLARLLDRSELRVVGAEDNTCAKSAHDEEETETPVDRLEGVLDVDTGTFGLGSHHRDILGSDDTESCAPHARQEALESSEAAAGKIFGESTRGVPVAESVRVALRVATDHGDESEAEQDEDQDDLATGQPEFRLTISLDCEDVEETSRCDVSTSIFRALVEKARSGRREVAKG